MASTPKPISLQDLAGAVHTAVATLKTPPPATNGPFAYINPGIICGIIYVGRLEQLPEARGVAASIAKQVSAHTGVTVAPVVQEAAAATEHAPSALPSQHIILGYKPTPEIPIRF